MTEDPVAISLTAWVRDYMRQVTSDELVALGTGDLPLSVAMHQVLDIAEYQDAYHAIAGDRVIAPCLNTSGESGPILFAPWTRLFLWANQLPMGILAAAALEASLEGIALSPANIEAKCLSNLEATRAICRGKPYRATVASAISGVTLPPNLDLRTSFGRFAPLGSELGSILVGRTPATTLVVSKVSVQVARYPASDTAGHVDRATNDALTWLSTRICAAFLLALGTERDARPLISSQTVVAPFAAWTSSLSPYHEDRGTADLALSHADVRELETVSNALVPDPVANIRIALERMLAAATERVDPSDVLIDAVIAWENLVGTSLETTFRVTAALSWLLAPDSFKERAELSGQLKRLYDRRSKVVHGAKVLRGDLDADAHLALHTSVDAARRLLLDHFWLCEISKSDQRNNAILLGDPRFKTRTATAPSQ